MALVVMGVVIAAIFNVVISARKAQSMAVAQASLKVEAQKSMARIYKELMQSRRLIASGDGEDLALDQGRDFFNYIQAFPGLFQPVPAAERSFPRINGSDATTPGSQDDTAIGNTLIFLQRVVELPITGYTIAFGSTGGTRTLTPQKPYRVYVYRMVAYYLSKRPLPPNLPPINGGSTYTYTLCRWESSPYFEWGEITGFLRRLPDAASKITAWNNLTGTVRNDKFFSSEKIVGAFDVGQIDPTDAVMQINAAGDLVPSGEKFKGHETEMLTRFPRLGEAISMVSFNTGDDGSGNPFYPNFRIPGNFQVPAYATSFNPTTVPYGFEVGITGSNSARTVLLRLALATRLNTGLHTYGVANQQLVQVFDN